jgi:cytoskeletal protein RodZ
MSDDFKALGTYLKNQRLSQNLSLKEVENATSIRSSYLEHIEEGRTKELVSSVYALGFMKQYASFLGVDVEAIMKENPSAFKLPIEKHEFAYGIGTLEMRSPQGKPSKGMPIGMILGALPIFGALLWGVMKLFGVL